MILEPGVGQCHGFTFYPYVREGKAFFFHPLVNKLNEWYHMVYRRSASNKFFTRQSTSGNDIEKELVPLFTQVSYPFLVVSPEVSYLGLNDMATSSENFFPVSFFWVFLGFLGKQIVNQFGFAYNQLLPIWFNQSEELLSFGSIFPIPRDNLDTFSGSFFTVQR
jgi:hypothetical protein